MSPITATKYVTPDGVERNLRFTFGAQKRIVDKYGMRLFDVLNKYDSAALPDCLYACMFDEHGNPPKDLDAGWFAENSDPADAAKMLAALLEAISQGKASKNELEALIRVKLEETTIGSTSGVSPINASASP